MNSYHPNIPKAQRYTIWQKCENTTLAILESVVATSHCSGEKRLDVLQELSYRLDLLKVFIRLTKDTYSIDSKHYDALQTIIQEIGKMTGGWIKSVKD